MLTNIITTLTMYTKVHLFGTKTWMSSNVYISKKDQVSPTHLGETWGRGERDRERDRHTDRHTGIQTGIQRQRERETQRDTERDRDRVQPVVKLKQER